MNQLQLFQPLRLPNGTTIKNRFLKPALSEVMGDENYRPTEKLISLYEHWAAGGTGLLITGNVMVDSSAIGEKGNIVIENEDSLDLLKKWAAAGSQNNTQFWVQLNHPGRQSPKNVSKHPVAPSAIPLEGPNAFAFNPPRALTVAEIQEIIARFATSAAIVKKAGFGGLQIHGAHGYLLSQFLSPTSNQRTDQYGGSLENRMRIIKEIYLAIRQQVGPEFPIGLKINSSDYRAGGFSEEESIQVIEAMADLGVDLIEISGGNYESPDVFQNANDKGAFFTNYAAKVKKIVNVPIAVTGGFRTLAGMEQTIENHEAEMVGLARGLTLLPDLPNQAQNGSFDHIAIGRLSTGLKFLDKKIGSYIGLSYYQMIMEAIAEGKPVKQTKNAWKPLFFALRTQGLSMVLPNRA